MNDKVNVDISEGKKYEIILDFGFKSLKKYINGEKKYFIVTDSNVAQLYLKQLCDEVFGKEIDTYILPAGENSKNFNTIKECYHHLLKKDHDRSTILIAFGGGVVGDMAGFAASTYMRGIKYIQIPTTLLSMVDSSVGGKTGYDFEGTKNIIGSFHQPELVYSNLSCLNTLIKKEFNTGMVECIKHGLIIDKDYFSFIEVEKENISNLKEEQVLTLVKRSCEIKAKVVEQDEKESGLRELLNFGHTIGHAIEAASNYSLTHGECVALGIRAAINASDIREEEVTRITRILKYFDLPQKYPGEENEVIKHLKNDKKFRNGKYSFVKLREIGNAYREKFSDLKIIQSFIDHVI